jgi:hypothetical protein
MGGGRLDVVLRARMKLVFARPNSFLSMWFGRLRRACERNEPLYHIRLCAAAGLVAL